MRLWHKDLIPYLPRKQLIAQWRELCAIISNIANKGTPNHSLVNKVLSSSGDFYAYANRVIGEMVKRKYKVNQKAFNNFYNNLNLAKKYFSTNSTSFNIYPYWHDERYLKQCLFNLQEKYDCELISEEEWLKISNEFTSYLY